MPSLPIPTDDQCIALFHLAGLTDFGHPPLSREPETIAAVRAVVTAGSHADAARLLESDWDDPNLCARDLRAAWETMRDGLPALPAPPRDAVSFLRGLADETGSEEDRAGLLRAAGELEGLREGGPETTL